MGKGRDKRRKAKEKKQKRQPPPSTQEPAHVQPDRTNGMVIGFRLNYGASDAST